MPHALVSRKPYRMLAATTTTIKYGQNLALIVLLIAA